MAGIDRAVAKARRHLTPHETLLTSAAGYEDEGRRRQVVLITDRRILVVGLRNGAPIELSLTATSVTYDRVGGRLRFADHHDEVRAIVRQVDADAARQILVLLDDHRTLPDEATAPRVQHVHIRCEDADG